jgi:hypothetical protein
VTTRLIDYYAVLQVHPDAEQEVIEAAYRQLMRKYHPDVAAGDEVMAARFHNRAKQINQAHAVLRDWSSRRNYDWMRQQVGTTEPPPHEPAGTGTSPSPSNTSWSPPPSQSPPVDVQEIIPQPNESRSWAVLHAPLAALSAAYYLMPGPYEWEPTASREVRGALLLPLVCVVGWLAMSGRLAPLVGRSPYSLVGVWVILGLILLMTQSRRLPQLAFLVGSSFVLASGVLDAQLHSAALPAWSAWLVVGALNVALAARLFVFGIAPSIGVCWLISRLA